MFFQILETPSVIEFTWRRIFSTGSFPHSCSFDWVNGVVNNVIKGTPLIVIGSEKGKIVFIAPLEKKGNTIKFIGEGYTHGDYFDFIYFNINKEIIDEFIWFMTLRYPFHKLLLSKIKDTSKTYSILKDHPLPYRTIEKDYYLIDTNNKDYLTDVISNHTRRDITKKVKKILKEGSITRSLIISGRLISERELDTIFKLYKTRLNEKLGCFCFNETYMDFFKNYIRFSPNSRVFILYLNNEIGAFSIGFRNGNIIEQTLNHHNPKYSTYSFGSMAIIEQVLKYSESDDISFINMGYGGDEYKKRFGGQANKIICCQFNFFTNFSLIRKTLMKCCSLDRVKGIINKASLILTGSFNNERKSTFNQCVFKE